MYHFFQQQVITEFSSKTINGMYDRGFVFTRLGKGVMQQIESVRVRVEGFEMSSENRRVMRKTDTIRLQYQTIPFGGYDWRIGKLAKDFYDTKFGKGIMSVNKIREMMREPKVSNMNGVFLYYYRDQNDPVGYCLCTTTDHILHYSYPFYDLSLDDQPNLGIGMMLRAIVWAKSERKEYVYLGSKQKYKMQFSGIEVYDPDYGWR